MTPAPAIALQLLPQRPRQRQPQRLRAQCLAAATATVVRTATIPSTIASTTTDALSTITTQKVQQEDSSSSSNKAKVAPREQLCAVRASPGCGDPSARGLACRWPATAGVGIVARPSAVLPECHGAGHALRSPSPCSPITPGFLHARPDPPSYPQAFKPPSAIVKNSAASILDRSQPEVSLRNFKLGRSIGRGAFGRVKVIVMRNNGRVFALKYMNKEQCVMRRTHRNIIRERSILEHLEHRFIVNLRYAFQDEDNLYFVMDLMLGGDLRFHLSRLGRINESASLFYAAELVSALAYLHSRGVVHRDIKPDNVLLCTRGHVHITDFNCATVINGQSLFYAKTGTPGYMAPEVYSGAGYGTPVDWWSLGVLLFELLHGYRPFRSSRLDKLIDRIMNTNHHCSTQFSRPVRQLLNGFLEKDPKKRLGCGAEGPKKIFSHPAFESVDYRKIVSGLAEPPFVPDTSSMNFDTRHALEDILLDDCPLRAARKKRKERQEQQKKLIKEQKKAHKQGSAVNVVQPPQAEAASNDRRRTNNGVPEQEAAGPRHTGSDSVRAELERIKREFGTYDYTRTPRAVAAAAAVAKAGATTESSFTNPDTLIPGATRVEATAISRDRASSFILTGPDKKASASLLQNKGNERERHKPFAALKGFWDTVLKRSLLQKKESSSNVEGFFESQDQSSAGFTNKRLVRWLKKLQTKFKRNSSIDVQQGQLRPKSNVPVSPPCTREKNNLPAADNLEKTTEVATPSRNLNAQNTNPARPPSLLAKALPQTKNTITLSRFAPAVAPTCKVSLFSAAKGRFEWSYAGRDASSNRTARGNILLSPPQNLCGATSLAQRQSSTNFFPISKRNGGRYTQKRHNECSVSSLSSGQSSLIGPPQPTTTPPSALGRDQRHIKTKIFTQRALATPCAPKVPLVLVRPQTPVIS